MPMTSDRPRSRAHIPGERVPRAQILTKLGEGNPRDIQHNDIERPLASEAIERVRFPMRRNVQPDVRQ
jgi:hypothetical protein